MYQQLRKKPIYRLVVWSIFLAGLLLLIRMSSTLVAPEYLPADDFGHFWAAGKLTFIGQDPYDSDQIMNLLYQVGRPQAAPGSVISVMLNPPWTLPIVIPFGLLDYPVSRMLWLLVNITVMIVCAELLWQIYGGMPGQRWIAWVLAFAFAPSISVLQKGQFIPFMLLGLVFFLKYHPNPRSGFWVGATLTLATIKPQLLYLFWVALLIWCIQTRNWRLPLGGFTTLVAATLIALAFNPQVISDYRNNLTNFPITQWATPSIGSYLRILFGLEKFWLQFVPPILGCIWLLQYWSKHHQSWVWAEQLPRILLISLVTAPYYWTYDLALLVPLAIQVFVLLQPKKIVLPIIGLWLSYLALHILDLLLHRSFDELWFGWFAPALLIWYLVAQRLERKPHPAGFA
ncbi:MAG: DUF2029 domain-containing protein [Anaerolineales bacterium]|nr:DUF2029 domain-containing protein [Anaerolineales bacterium]